MNANILVCPEDVFIHPKHGTRVDHPWWYPRPRVYPSLETSSPRRANLARAKVRRHLPGRARNFDSWQRVTLAKGSYGFAELLAIRDLGPEFFVRDFLPDLCVVRRRIIGWRSMSCDYYGIMVPILFYDICVHEDNLMVLWSYLKDVWLDECDLYFEL